MDQAYSERIREDSRAALRILQLLSGEKFVEIIPGSPENAQLPENSIIETQEGQALLEQAQVTAENLNEITISLRNILSKMESGEGLIGRMIQDPEFGTRGVEALGESMENIQAITEDLRRGHGVIGRLLTDESFAEQTEELFAAVHKVAGVIDSIDLERGALGALLREGGAGQRAIEDFAVAASSLRRFSARLESDQSIMGQMLADAEGGEDFAEDLRRLMNNLAQISEKINRGEGTLGALVNERALYDGMEDVVAGVNDSKFARWLLRRYQKKGIKAQDKREDEQEQAAQDEPDPAPTRP